MTDLYYHFSFLLDKSSQERNDYLAATVLAPDERLLLERMLANCEHMPGDTQLLAELQPPSNEAEPVDLNELQGLSIGPYRLSHCIGKGGMGVVYLANRVDGRFEQRVAFKLIYPSIARVAGLSLQQEAQLLSKIRHPVITQVLDAGMTDNGLHYIMMEFIEGQTLDVFLQKHELPLTEKIKLILPLVDAVCAAHALNIVHGDLKPANILVTPARKVKLLDFGIAKQVMQDSTQISRMYLQALSLPFAAPEQLNAEPATVASDQYALGAALYLCLTGGHPFHNENIPYHQMVQLKQLPLQPWHVEHASFRESLEVRYQLAAVVHKAMSLKAADRYASVMDFKTDLQHFLSGYPLQHQSKWYWQSAKWLMRHRLLAMIGASLVVGSSILLYQNQQIRFERNNAQQIAQHLEQLFQSTDPLAPQPTISAAELLHRGTDTIRQDEKLSPTVRHQLIRVIAQSYFNIGDYTNAERLIRESLNQQISEDRVDPATLRFYCTISEYFKTPFDPTASELAAVSRYFTELSRDELLTPENASALLSFLTKLRGTALELDGFSELQPYLPQLIALFPDNRWKTAILLKAEYQWSEKLAQLRAGEINEQQWLEFNKENLPQLLSSIEKTHPLHPNYVELIEVTLNTARITELIEQQPALAQKWYQRLEDTLQLRLAQAGTNHGSVIQALNSTILAAEYLDDWALVDKNIQRLSAYIQQTPNELAQHSKLLRHQAALFLRQGRRQELLELSRQWVERLNREPELLTSFNFFHLVVLADGLTALEEKQALAQLLPLLTASLQNTKMDQDSADYYQQQLRLRQMWSQSNNLDDAENSADEALLAAFTKTEFQSIYLEAALLSNQISLAKTELDKSLENIELTLKFCPPSYCDNNLLITVLPIKMAELEFSQQNPQRGQQMLEIVKRYAQQSNNSASNTWLQQAEELQQKYRLQQHD